MKTKISILLLLLVSFAPMLLTAQQETKAKVIIKMEHDENGNITVFDTILDSESDALEIIELETKQLEGKEGKMFLEVKARLDSVQKELEWIELTKNGQEISIDSIEKTHKIIVKKLDTDEEGLEELEMKLKLLEKELNEDMLGEEGAEVEVRVEMDKNDNIKVHKVIIYSEDGEEVEHGIGDADVRIEKIVKDDGSGVQRMVMVRISTARIEKINQAEEAVFAPVLEKIGVEQSQKLQVEDLKFYPNPSDGEFTLELGLKKEGPVDIEVYDLNGKKVHSVTIQAGERHITIDMNLQGHPAGSYLMVIKQDSAAITRKVILK